MSLFSISDVERDSGDSSCASQADASASAVRCFTAESGATLSRALGDIESSLHVASCGAFSMHQLAFYVLKVVGPARLYATTWAINEDVASMLLRAQQEGLLRSVTFLFDWRVRKYKPKAYALAAKNFTTHVTSLHAKVCVLEGEQRSVCVVGSANWTRNSKMEAFYVCVDEQVSNFWRDFINEQVQRRAAQRG
jgi:hypothetical protein